MKLTFFGHSTFLVETGGKKLLFDPFITGNELAKDIDIDSIEADYILASHGHGDHIAEVESISKRCGSTLIANYEVAMHFNAKGVKIHPINPGGKKEFDFGTVRCVNAIHSSSFPDGSYAGQPCGFVIWNVEDCFYFSGDTALTLDMQLIPKICPKLDFSILPIGDNFTMGYEDAVIAAQFVDTDINVACHFDTFGYIKTDKEAAVAAFENAGKKLIIPEIGKEVNF